MITRPSRLVVEAAGLSPDQTQKAVEAGVCAMCGHQHEVGDPIAPFDPADSFTDFTNLLAPESPVICGWCAACWNRDFTQTYLRSVISREGLFKCASNDHIAYWLLNPPEPPYMIFLGDQKVQHVVWRTPVNFSRKVMILRFGEKLMTVRPAWLQQAIEACRLLTEAINQSRQTNQQKRAGRPPKKVNSPFARLSRDMDDLQHSQLSNDAYSVAESTPELQQHINFIHSLTPGEIWGLNACLYAKNPEKPEPSLVPSQH